MLSSVLVCAQTPQQAPPSATPAPASGIAGSVAQLRSNYVLRPGDQILIRAADEEDISGRPWLIKEDGFVDLPLLGRTQAAGVSIESFEAALVEALKKYVNVPQVSVTVVQFASEPVFFVGAFLRPGIYPLTGQRNLVEMTASVGGLAPGAARRIKVTRHKEYGAIPLPNAITLPDGGTSVEINIATLQNNVNPGEDIVLEPYDVISVDLSEMIYVLGAGIGHGGAFALGQKDTMSVLQVLVQAGGVLQTAKLETAVILRPISNTSRRAVIPIDLKRILKGQGNDKPLLPNDVLYVEAKGGLQNPQTMQTFLPVLSLATIAISLASRF